jgi:hypothetical protein
MAAEYSISGESNTILRMRTTVDNKDIMPLYEYLRLSVLSPGKDGSAVSLHIGGWGRADVRETSTPDGATAADLQYGYISYQGHRNNLVVNAGRQFVTEGVATERLDGVYARTDLAGGFATAVFIGSPVVTEPSLTADDMIVGGRITQSSGRYYTVGISALKSYANNDRYREEEGVDLWLHPAGQVDITGRSSYNSITGGWMEHAYTASYAPVKKLRLSADLSNINYKDYFYNVTTTALVFNPLINGIDPDEKLLALGVGGAYRLSGNMTVAADYKHYAYDIAQEADYYGGKVSYSNPEAFGAGFSVHRMAGKADRLKYTEYRLYITKKVEKTVLTLDVIDQNFDSTTDMNGIHNSVTVVAAGSYEFSRILQLGASVDYSHNPLFDNELKGLVKLTYLFDVKYSTDGGMKREIK